jgi:MFS family permease
MRSLAAALYSIAVTAWVGSLMAIGFIAAPLLFARIADRTVAGALAGDMFAITAWVGLACGTYLILYLLAVKGWRAFQSGVFWIVLLMIALAAAGQFGVQPILAQLKSDALPRQVMESALRDRFATWHGVSSALYLVQTLLGIALLILQERGKGR